MQGGAPRPGGGRIGSSAKPFPPLFEHLHIAKTAGTTLNGNLSLHFERVCGHKGYSYDAYQANERREAAKKTGKGERPGEGERHWPKIMQWIGFEDCDWISQEDPVNFWFQFGIWDQPLELHVPCRDPIDHLLSQCGHQGKNFNCAGDLSKEIEKCMMNMDRFSNKLKSIQNVHLKCFDWRASFNGNY